jgi:hypothetical protein
MSCLLRVGKMNSSLALHKMADCSADKAFLRAIKLAASTDIKLFCHAKAVGDAFKNFN